MKGTDLESEREKNDENNAVWAGRGFPIWLLLWAHIGVRYRAALRRASILLDLRPADAYATPPLLRWWHLLGNV